MTSDELRTVVAAILLTSYRPEEHDGGRWAFARTVVPRPEPPDYDTLAPWPDRRKFGKDDELALQEAREQADEKRRELRRSHDAALEMWGQWAAAYWAAGYAAELCRAVARCPGDRP